MKRKLLPVLTFAKIDIRRLFRDKVGIFFVFLFPLILLFVFGTIFGKEDNNISFDVAVVNRSETQFAKDFASRLHESDIFEVDKSIENKGQAEEKLGDGQLSALIVLPEDFGKAAAGAQYPSGEAEVTYERGDGQTSSALSPILESIFDDINQRFVPAAEPFALRYEMSGEDEGLSRFDYTFAGLLGFTLLSLGVFGPTTVFPRMKEKGILRRYHTTPVRVWQYFAGNVLSNAFIGILAIAVMFTSAILLFDLNMRGDYFSLALMTVLGAVVLFGIGLAAGGWAKNENQAAPLGQLVALPMLFLSGVFFPRFIMPDWLIPITDFLPLTPVIDGFRMIVAEGQSVLDIGWEVGLLALWGVIIYALAFKLFRWE